MRSPGGGKLSLSACPGVGKRLPNENKIANPRGYARGGGGGMVTGRIEPCITGIVTFLNISEIGHELISTILRPSEVILPFFQLALHMH